MTAATLADDRAAELEGHRPALTRHCARMLGSQAEGEDAAQESLVRAWRSLDRFAADCTLRSWLYRIATNVCVDVLRRRRLVIGPVDTAPARLGQAAHRRMPATPAVAWVVPDPASGEAVARNHDGDPEDPADDAVARDQVRLACLTALQTLPSRQRAALVLCDALRWPAADAAALLGVSPASVNSALQRARATLATRRAAGPPERREQATGAGAGAGTTGADDRRRAERCVDAFARQDVASLLDVLAAP
jgi:RNA polymerase sigma-70 factor (ECF subfamily)